MPCLFKIILNLKTLIFDLFDLGICLLFWGCFALAVEIGVGSFCFMEMFLSV